MPLYFLLGTLNVQGQGMLRDNPDLVKDAIRECDCPGAEIMGQYAVLGKYDFVMLAEADDNESAARLSLDLGVRVGLHVETLPAMAIGVLNEDESGESDKTEDVRLGAGSPEDWRLPGSDA